MLSTANPSPLTYSLFVDIHPTIPYDKFTQPRSGARDKQGPGMNKRMIGGINEGDLEIP